MPFIFISSLLLIASIGDNFAALLADALQEKYIVITANITDSIIAVTGTEYINVTSSITFPIKLFNTIDNIQFTNIPSNIPDGIPINPNIAPSNSTFFLICFLVAPIDDNIPYCLVLSVIDIAKLFLITNTLEIIIITTTTIPTKYSILIYELFTPMPSNCSALSFKLMLYLLPISSFVIPVDSSIIPM